MNTRNVTTTDTFWELLCRIMLEFKALRVQRAELILEAHEVAILKLDVLVTTDAGQFAPIMRDAEGKPMIERKMFRLVAEDADD